MGVSALTRLCWLFALTVHVVCASACARNPSPQHVESNVSPLTAASAQPEPERRGPPAKLFATKFYAKIRSAPDKDASRLGYMRGGAVLTATTDRPLGFEMCRKGWYELTTGGFVCATTDAVAFSGDRPPARRPLQADLDARLPFPYGYSRVQGTPVYRRLPSETEWPRYEPPTASSRPVAASETSEPAVPPTLASLEGAAGSLLLRRMARGFYVSLDREIEHGTRTYWQTQAAGFIEKQHLVLVEGSGFHGLAIERDGPTLPIGFVINKRAKSFAMDGEGRLHSPQPLDYHRVFAVVSAIEIANKSYWLAADGGYYTARGITVATRRDKPREVGEDEKWIDVDLATQTLVAYVGARPVYVTAISSGRIKDERDPLRNFQTPVGSFRITSKHLTTTMDGDIALDGPYSIEDVPYVMYFSLAYALHAAFWHDSFGHPHSHGCVNLAPLDAKWLFLWSEPRLPEDWHGVYPRPTVAGTRVYVHGETPKG